MAVKLSQGTRLNSYQPAYSKWIFWLLLLVISYFYGFQTIAFLRPQPIHMWRQADCLSLATNYYQDNLGFLEPAIHNQMSDGGTSGRAAGEFPILYYFVAQLWKVFGKHEFIYRFVNLLIAFLGLFALFKLLEDMLKDSLWAIGITLLLFSSPIIIFYGSNFLPNVPALSMVFIGWYYFYQFIKKSLNRYLYWSMMLFLLATLLKVTAGISFLVILGIYFLEVFKLCKFREGKRLFPEPIKNLIPLLAVIAGNVIWYWYAKWYNDLHGGMYTFNNIWPIWKMDSESISKAWDSMRTIWVYQYFSKPVYWLLGVASLMILFSVNKINRFFTLSILAMFIGVIMYTLLWFNAMIDHDYYLINTLIFPLFILVTFAVYLKKHEPQIFYSSKWRIVFLIFVAYNICYGANNIRMRYWKHVKHDKTIATFFVTDFERGYWAYFRDNNRYKDFEDIEPYNRSLGIEPDDLVISLSDRSINVSLYLMNQKGWPRFNSSLTDSSGIADKIGLGAKYLFILKDDLNQSHVKPFIRKKLGEHGKVQIFDISIFNKNLEK